MTTNLAIMALITGFFLPFLTGVLTKSSWAQWKKFVIVIVSAVIVGAFELWGIGEFADLTWVTAYAHLGSIYVASGASFWLLINTTGLKNWLYSVGFKDKA